MDRKVIKKIGGSENNKRGEQRKSMQSSRRRSLPVERFERAQSLFR